MAYFISDGEGGIIPLEGSLPAGYSGPVFQGRWDGQEWQDMTPVDPAIVNDPALQYGAQGSLPYQLASEGRLQGGLSNPEAVSKFLTAVAPNYDWSNAIQSAYQDQVSQFGSGFNSGADDPAQTALKIIQASGQPWAADAENYIRATPQFAQSQAMGAQAQQYAEHQNDGTILGIPGEAAALGLGIALGPAGLNLSSLLGGGAVGAAGTGAISSALLGGDPLKGALFGGLAPGLQEAGLSPEAASAASAATKFALSGGGDLGSLFNGALSLAGNVFGGGETGPSQEYDPSIQDQQDAELGQAMSNYDGVYSVNDLQDAELGQAMQDFPQYQQDIQSMYSGVDPFVDGVDARIFGAGDPAAKLLSGSYQAPAISAPESMQSLGGTGWFSGVPAGYYLDDNGNLVSNAPDTTSQEPQLNPSQETGNNMDIFGENNATFDPATQDWLNTYFDLGNATDGVFAEGNQGMSEALSNPTLPANMFTGGNANSLGGLLGTAIKTIFGTNADGTTKIPGASTNANGSSNGMLPLLAVLAGGLLGARQGSNTPAGNTTVTQDVPDWQKPYITGMLDNASKVYKAAEDNNGFLSNGRNTLNSAISGDFLNANPSNAIYGAAAGYNNPYEGLLQPTATGAFLNSNPYLDATYDKASRALTDQYKYATMPNISKQFGHMQAFGGNSGYDQSVGLAQKNLATGLGDLATNIYGGNYANERGLMQNAQTGLLGSSNTTQGIRLSGAGGLGGNFNTARQQQLSAATTAPGYASETTNNAFAPINNYANLVGRSFGSQTQQPYFTNQSGGMLSGALGGLALSNLFKG